MSGDWSSDLCSSDLILLYGDGKTAPYGVLSHADATASLTYALRTGDGRTVIWNMVFADGTLQYGQMLLR